MAVNLKSLVGKLNDTTRSTLEASAGLCLSRTHYDVEIEHFLLKLLDQTDTDAQRILKHFGVDPSRLTTQLSKALDLLKTGNARTPSFSPHLVKMFTDAWTIGSLDFAQPRIRSGAILLAIASNEELSRMVNESSREFAKIEPEVLRKEFFSLVTGSCEDDYADASMEAGGVAGAPGKAGGKTPNLDQFTVDLTERAKTGKLDPVLGRDKEVRQIVDILMRRRQNNPILTGEAGVGKTAVVEGFAQRVAEGDVPPPLRNVTIRTLDLALLQAGAGIKGEFENRLKGLIEEVKRSEVPIILFIDEAHTMIGAGGQAGQGDAANLLKPALARGELRTIAATTWSEYKKYFEKDPALARRFQVVKVDEPTEEVCRIMMRGVVATMEKHHNVRVLDEAVSAAVGLSHRYLAGRQLPDKAVSILDTACARLALTQTATPPAIEDLRRRLQDLEVQERILNREVVTGTDHTERLREISEAREKAQSELTALEQRFEAEAGMVARMRELREKLEANPKDEESLAELKKLEADLDEIQGESPLLRVCVDAQVVSEVLSAWTGIPVGKMLKDEISTVLTLDETLGKRLIGQDHALKIIAQRIVTSRARMDDPVKPVGVFLLVGPSGVGKTETALALSDLLYGGERNMISINMSEFQEAHTVSTLKGAPPGYVGYGEGGVLTEAVRRRPYSVVLLDEVEKAHPDVLELFFQVFDKGQMEDGEGREIDFKNTIILLTSNAATETMMKLTADPETMPTPDALVKAMKPELDKVFKPAFLGRLVIVPYYPVRDEALKKIIVLKLRKIQKRMAENHKVTLDYTPALVDTVAERCTEVESGARNVDNILTNSLLPEISRELLSRMSEGLDISHVEVGVDEAGVFQYQF